MLSLAHTIISLPLANIIQNPFLIFIAAFVFHLFTDTILHWNIYPDQFKKYPFHLVIIDMVGGLLIAWLILKGDLFTIPYLAAIAGGNAPDALNFFWELIPPKTRKQQFAWALPFFHFHDRLQLETNNIIFGLAPQAAAILLAIALLQL